MSGAAGRARAQLARRREDGVREALDSPNGRALLWSILETGGPYVMSADAASADGMRAALMTYFREGRRSVANELLSLILEVDPKAYAALLEEFAQTTPRRTQQDD